MVCELYPLSAKNKIQKQSYPTSNKHKQPLNFCFLKIFPTKRYEETDSNNQKNKKILELLGEMANSKAGQEKYKIHLEHLNTREKKI